MSTGTKQQYKTAERQFSPEKQEYEPQNDLNN